MTEFEGFDELVVELEEMADNAEEMADNAEQRYDDAMFDVVLSVTEMASNKAPVASGELADSIGYSKVGLLNYRIGSSVDHADDMEYGTTPHMITGDPLHFFADGDEVFVKRVRHPGTDAQPFLRPSLRAHEHRLIREMKRVTRELVYEAME